MHQKLFVLNYKRLGPSYLGYVTPNIKKKKKKKKKRKCKNLFNLHIYMSTILDWAKKHHHIFLLNEGDKENWKMK